jgi:ribonuclease P protein component
MITLKRKKDFSRLYKFGRQRKNLFARLVYLRNEEGENRIAVVVSKKIGKATVRNLIRRKFLAVLKAYSWEGQSIDIAIFPAVMAKNAHFSELRLAIYKLLENI